VARWQDAFETGVEDSIPSAVRGLDERSTAAFAPSWLQLQDSIPSAVRGLDERSTAAFAPSWLQLQDSNLGPGG
jgi:hypothetical protein